MRSVEVRVVAPAWEVVTEVSTVHGNAAGVARRLRALAGPDARVGVSKDGASVLVLVDGAVSR